MGCDGAVRGCTYNVLVTTVGLAFCILLVSVGWRLARVLDIVTGVGVGYGLNRRFGKYELNHRLDISLIISTLNAFCEG